MELKIYSRVGTLRMAVSPSDSSAHVHELMGENVVNVSFTRPEYMQLDVNDYIELDGRRYTVRSAYQPTQKSTLEYTYNVKFYGRESETQRVKMLYLTDGNFEPKFSLDGSPAEHLQKVIDNLNRISGTNTWVLGSVISAPNQNIEYNNVFCSEALSLISEAFETEWWIEGNTLNLSRCEYGDLIELGYMKGLTELNREENANDVKFFTRLIPLGTTRNIDRKTYGFSRLQLPNRAKYVEQNTEYGLYEAVEEEAFSAIYPKRIGKVSSIRSEEKTGEDKQKFTIYYFADATLNFNPNDYDMEGLVKHVVFQSGELNGRDFEVNYNATKKEFEIITQFPDESSQLPGGHLIPGIGDEYILYNLKMPTEYITAAEQEYKKAVDAYLAKFSVDSAIYRGNTDYIHISEKNLSLRVGRRVRLLSDKFFPATGYRDSRITKITRKLNNPAQATIECTNAVGKGRLATIESDMTEMRNVVADRLDNNTLNVLRTWDSSDLTDYNLLSSKRVLKEIKQRALSRLNDDNTAGHITFEKGITTLNLLVQELARTYDLQVDHVATLFQTIIKDFVSSETFVPGMTGEGMKLYKALSGDWNLELDNVTVRKAITTFEMVIAKIRAVNGGLVVSAANGSVKSVSETTGDPAYYVLGIEGDMTFVADDLVRCQVFTAGRVKHYWLPIEQINGDSILLLKSGFPAGVVPAVGDELVQMGNRTDVNRQGVLYLTASEDGRPRFSVLDGINSPSLAGKNNTVLGCLDGITDTDLPADFQPSGYGLYSMNVFLKGIFILRNGKSIDQALTELSTQIEAIPGQISMKVTEEVGKIQLGGRNYLRNSGNWKEAGFNGGWTNNGGGYTIDNSVTFNGKPTLRTSVGSGIIHDWINLENNVEYTYSAMIKSDQDIAGNWLTPLHYWTGKDSVKKDSITAIKYDTSLIANEWKLLTLTFKLTGDLNSFRPFIYIGPGNATFWVAYTKLEKGNKATDWTPAPEDMDARMTQAEFNLKPDKIWLGIKSNIQLGGRNYFKKSTSVGVLYGSPGFNLNDPNAPNGLYLVGDSSGNSAARMYNVIDSNGLWTISFDVKGTQGTNAVAFRIDVCGNPEITANRQAEVHLTSDNEWHHHEYTFNVQNYSAAVFNFVDFESLGWLYIYVRNLKIEKGSFATDWTPAPEDMDARMTQAENNLQPENIWNGVKPNVQASTVPRQTINIDARGLDENMYYPLIIHVPTAPMTTITLHYALGGVKPSWATHEAGFSVQIRWTTNGYGWGTIGVQRIIHEATQSFNIGNVAGSIGQLGSYNKEYIYVRGGGYYHLSVEGTELSPHTGLYPNGYQEGNDPYVMRIDPVSSVTFPVASIPAIIETGIDITNRKMVLTADKTVFRNNSGGQIAVFENDRIKADLIDARQIVVNGLNAGKVTTGNLNVTEGAEVGPFVISSGGYMAADNKVSMLGMTYGGRSTQLSPGTLSLYTEAGSSLLVTGGGGITLNGNQFNSNCSGYSFSGGTMNINNRSMNINSPVAFCGAICVNVRKIYGSALVWDSDYFIACYNTSSITLTLPANPWVGRTIIIKRMNNYSVKVYGSPLYKTYAADAKDYQELTKRGELQTYVFDGQYWQCNWHTL